MHKKHTCSRAKLVEVYLKRKPTVKMCRRVLQQNKNIFFYSCNWFKIISETLTATDVDIYCVH